LIAVFLLACGSPRLPVNVPAPVPVPVPVPVPDHSEARSLPSEVHRIDAFPLPAGATGLSVSADARHLAYRPVSEDQREHFVVQDGERQGPWHRPPDPLVWSDEGGHLAYFAERVSDGTLTVVADGREGDPDERLARIAEPRGWSRAGSLAWSAGGEHLAATLLRNDRRGFRTEVFVDGAPSFSTQFRETELSWSRTGSKLAIVGQLGPSFTVHVDGWEKPCAQVDSASLTWRDDSVEFAGECDGRRALFGGDSPVEVPAALVAPAARFGGRIAYAILAARQHQLVLDDRIRATHDQIADIAFLPDGSSVVFRAVDRNLHRVVVLDAWESEPAESVVPGSLTVRSDGACVAWTELGYGQYQVRTKGVAGRGEPCEDDVHGPYGSASKPIWNDDGTVSFTSTLYDESVLHVGDEEIALGGLPEALLAIARAPDGRLAHFAAVDGSLWSVLRASGDLSPVATLVRPSPRPERDDPGTTVSSAGALFDDATGIAVDDRGQRVAFVAAAGDDGPHLFLDGEEGLRASKIAGPSFSDDGHFTFASAVTLSETEVVVDGAVTGRLETPSRLVAARRGTNWLAVYWQGFAHRVRSSATGRSFSVGQSPPGVVSAGADATHFLVTTTSDYPVRILFDGRTVARGDWLDRVRWSEDGAHVLFAVGSGDRQRLFRDGAVVVRAHALLPLGFDRAGTAAWAETDDAGATRVVVGGRPSAALGAIVPESVRWDAHFEHVALVAVGADRRSTVVRDTDVVKAGLEGARDPTWSPDGARLAWATDTGVSLDGESIASDTGVVGGSLRFAPDGRSLGWLSRGRDLRGDPAVRARIGDATYGPYETVESPGIVFSPAGQAAWIARRGATRLLVADGRTVATFDERLPGADPTWLDDGALGLVAVRVRRDGLGRIREAVRIRWRP